MHALSMVPAALRSLLALLLLAGFTVRAGGVDLAHRCPAAAPHTAAHAGHGQGHRPLPAGTDRCECVGQSCTTAVVVPGGRTGLVVPVRHIAWLIPSLAPAPLRSAVPHLLPFAQGPPA